MTQLGTSKRPAVVRVQTQARAEEILSTCDRHGWKVIVGVEPDQDEDVSDVERLLRPPEPAKAAAMPGRNDPCPCGSGRKFKRCCLLKSPGPGERTTGEFRFEPGSYGGPGVYMPSLACFRKSASGEKEYRFVLANQTVVVDSEPEAVAQATADFSEACRVDDATGSIEALGRQLSARGYVMVENFNVVGEDS